MKLLAVVEAAPHTGHQDLSEPAVPEAEAARIQKYRISGLHRTLRSRTRSARVAQPPRAGILGRQEPIRSLIAPREVRIHAPIRLLFAQKAAVAAETLWGDLVATHRLASAPFAIQAEVVERRGLARMVAVAVAVLPAHMEEAEEAVRREDLATLGRV